MQNLGFSRRSRCQLVIDGQEIETEGMTCIIANSGNMAQRNLSLLPGIDISDGVLDVIVIQPAGLRLFTDLVGGMTGLINVDASTDVEGKRAVQWWQAKEVRLVSTPAQTVQLDGEVLGAPAVSAGSTPSDSRDHARPSCRRCERSGKGDGQGAATHPSSGPFRLARPRQLSRRPR